MSDTTRLLVVYYSSYGTNHRLAEIAADAAEEAGAEVRLRRIPETAPDAVVESQDAWRKHLEETAHIPEVTPDDLRWADGFIFSSPTRFGNAASQMRAFIDTLGPLWQQGELADKTFSAMTSAMNAHGGQETTLQTLYFTAMHWGAIPVPPGYTDEVLFEAGGNPYGASVTAGDAGVTDEIEAAVRHQATRQVELTQRLTQPAMAEV